MTKINPFDFVKSINRGKEHLLDSNSELESSYVPFLTNKAFSYFPDTIFDSNIMNFAHVLDAKLQYDYYFYSLSAGNRFSKWAKSDSEKEEDLKFIMELFSYSREKALGAYPLLCQNLSDLRDRYRQKQP